MKYTSPGHFRTAEEFRSHLQSLRPDFDCVTELSGADGPLGQPLALFDGKTAGNRFAVQPMEGWDADRDGTPSEHTLRRWRNFGRSGAKLVWGGEAFAVQEDGRANPNQLFLNRKADVAGGLAALRQQILDGHREQGLSTDDLVIGLQLTHSGRFSKPGGLPAPKRAYAHPLLDRRFNVPADTPILRDADLIRIGENFVRAAKLAREAGFDFVDIKCCHNYLLHELLSARTRRGPYGGGFKSRTNLFRRIVEGIRIECPGLGIGVRLSVFDGFPHSADPVTNVGARESWPENMPYEFDFGVNANDPMQPDLAEPFAFLELLLKYEITLVNVTLGSPYYCPHVIRPAAYPPTDGYLPPEDPLLSVHRHLSLVREVKREFPQLIVVGSGYTYLQEWLANVAEHEAGSGHVDFAGLGRMMLTYPEYPFHALERRPLQRKRICRTFSDCTSAPRNGLRSGCYPLDPYYKDSPEADTLKEIKKAKQRA